MQILNLDLAVNVDLHRLNSDMDGLEIHYNIFASRLSFATDHLDITLKSYELHHKSNASFGEFGSFCYNQNSVLYFLKTSLRIMNKSTQ